MAPNDSNTATPVSFPMPAQGEPSDSNNNATTTPQKRSRTSTATSAASNRIRAASIKLMEATPPPGMWAATGNVISKAPSLSDIRGGSFGSAGWTEEQQKRRRRGLSQGATEGGAGRLRSSSHSGSPDVAVPAQPRSPPSPAGMPSAEPFPTLTEEELEAVPSQKDGAVSTEDIHKEKELGGALRAEESTPLNGTKETGSEKGKPQRQVRC